jgi:CubicO group peptidase (beta-lactamase class C family)
MMLQAETKSTEEFAEKHPQRVRKLGRVFDRRNDSRSRCFGLLSALVLFVGAYCHSWLVRASEDPTANQIAPIFTPLVSNQEPGLAVLVRLNGRTLFKQGYGRRDLRSGALVDARSNFRLASCTKQFTAMAVLLLVQDGKLRLDETLRDVFPEFPAYGRAVTIRNLLNHSSGLVAYEDLMDTLDAGKPWQDIPQISDAGVLDLMAQQTATKFPPGSAWEYSNSGYCVLARVVEKASGMPFADFLRRRIFVPLKMHATVAYEYGKNDVASRAYGYTKDAGTWLETDQSPTSATLGDGGIYSSLDDLGTWDEALRRHALLSEAAMRPALTPVALPEHRQSPCGAPIRYGFGWFLDPYRGHQRMWHYGESIGFRAVIERFPADGLTIVILANRTDLDPPALALKVADLYLR